ncbi:MAG: peptidoglycan DD-metalloendopeptidase family protein [Micromonosporaceae bacterium]|nr:peptidoglycan DD-metalloendopeptidase family protein [Micromonosporaceae bacterium]
MTMPPSVSAAAGLQEDLEQAEEDAAEALEHATEAERKAAEQYAEATEALPAAKARLKEARALVDDAGAAVESAAQEEESATEELDRVTLRHDRLQVEVERAADRVDTIASAAYKGSGMYSAAAVLSANGPQDAINRLGLIGRVAVSERDAMEELAAAQADAGVARDQADDARQRAEDARLAAQAALDDARTAEEDAEQAADEVAALIDARAEALAVAEREREKAEQELAQIEQDLREWEEANRDTAPVLESGELLMPVQGEKTSDYGMRTDPITGEQRLHSGVDFAAPGGTPITAAAAGTVINAGWNDGGYGNFTCVSHGTYEGQGLSTCYAHQSEILVSSDQSVQAGELIGRVGTTGNSTGNHLHFEVRLDGSPTDPLPWLPDCLC